jgi:LacI family transcriptional regulator
VTLQNKPEVRPSIRRIAAEVGLSPMAVSLALRDQPGVSSVTRSKIKSVARTLGYQPDAELSRLSALMRKGRSPGFHGTLAFLNLFPERDRGRWEAYYRGLLQGARERAHGLGFNLEEFWMREPGMTARRMTGILQARGVRGVLMPVMPDDMSFPELDWSRFTCVALTDSVLVPEMLRVVPDNGQAMHVLLEALDQRGYRRPAFHAVPAFDQRTRLMHTSVFLRWIYERGLDPALLAVKKFDRKNVAAWLDSVGADVLIAQHADPYASIWAEALPALRECPAFVSVAWAARFPHAAGVDKRTDHIGRNGVDLLAGAISRGEKGLQKDAPVLHVAGVWREGASCPPAGRRKRTLLALAKRLLMAE